MPNEGPKTGYEISLFDKETELLIARFPITRGQFIRITGVKNPEDPNTWGEYPVEVFAGMHQTSKVYSPVPSSLTRRMVRSKYLYKIMEELWNNYPDIVTIDRINEIIFGTDVKNWPAEDHSSQRAVAITRLRQRVSEHNIKIENVCRRGYKLVIPQDVLERLLNEDNLLQRCTL